MCYLFGIKLASLVMVDKSIGGRIMGGDIARLAEFRQDGFRQLLAKLHAPLIKRVDIPDNTLDEDLVLVHGNQGTKRGWSEFLKQDRVGRLVAQEDTVRDNLVVGVFAHLLAYLVLTLADHQCFSLGEKVG